MVIDICAMVEIKAESVKNMLLIYLKITTINLLHVKYLWKIIIVSETKI